MKRRIFIVFALLAFSSLAGAEVFYWLRGNDVKTGIDGGENFFISGTAPNASSTATEIIVETKKGTGIIGKWYSPAFSETFLLSGKAFLLANKFKQLLGNTAVGFSIYEFDEETLEETLIVSSGFEKPSPTLALEAGLENGFVVGSKKRLKLLVNYIEESGKGKLSLTLDEGFAFKETVFETPSGVKARATGADGTAVLVLDACLESGIACTTGTECSDQDNFTTDSCSLGGTCRALCVYTACGASCTSNAQCSDGEPLTFDKCEKLGFCDSFCTNDSCTPLCTSSTDCGDSNLLTLDTCMYPGTCVSACKNTPCSGGECSVTEQKVFCGDNVCQYQEDCPGDCEVGKNIGLLGYRKEDYFVLGEEIVFRAKPTGFSKKPAVFAKGFFGEIELFDNGQGKDEKALDGVFSGSATVPENTGGKTWVLFTAGVAGETIEITAAYAIAPVLELSLSTQQDSYMLGDLVKVSGEANKKRLPLFGESILVEFKSGAKTVSSQNAPVNELGFFEAEYRTSSVEEDGGLEVTAAAKDSFGNTANVSKTIFLPKQPRPVQGPVQNEAGQKINPASENITALQGTLLGVAQKNFLLVFAVLIAVAAVLVSKFLGKEKMQAKNRQEEEKRLTGELEHAQDLYFKKGLMSRKDYDEKMMKLEAKLLETRKKSRGKHT